MDSRVHYRGDITTRMLAVPALLAGLFAGVLVFVGGCWNLGILACDPDPYDPLQGQWTERSTVSCEDNSETEGSIGEIIFCQGQFSVTWRPFEFHLDYWGVYVLNSATNQMTMTVTGGNYIPEDTDLAGTVEFEDDGSIALRGIFLGSKAGTVAVAACGHILDPH